MALHHAEGNGYAGRPGRGTLRPISATPELHPAENRGYRELYAATQQLVRHWERLGARVAGSDSEKALTSGVAAARRLLTELADLTPRYSLYGTPAARGVGARAAGAKNEVRDRFLERNQALRLALLDVQHLRTLVTYLGAVAEHRGEEELTKFGNSWQRRLSTVERSMRAAVVAEARDPDLSVEPLDDSPAGRAAHRVAYAAGAVGEWIDRRAASMRDGE